VRAGLAVAAVVALGQFVHQPGLMEAALAGLLTCLCDAGGTVRQRLPALLAFSVVGTVFVAGFGLLRAGPAWLAVACATSAVFACSFARVFGQAAMQVGNLLTVVVALALRSPLRLPQALMLALMFAAGCAWAVLLTLVIWRLHPFRPARRAVGAIYRALSRMAADQRATLEAGQTDEAVWDRHARLHRRAVREAIEKARALVLATVRARGAQSARGMQAWVRMEIADQLFAAMIALSDLLASDPDPALIERSRRMLRLLPKVLLLAEREVEQGRERPPPGLDRAVTAVAAVTRAPQAAHDPLARIGADLSERLHLALYPADPTALPPAGDAPLRWWSTVRSNLSPGSAPLRHAARCALAAGLAIAATIHWPLPYGHWFTIVLILTMQPYFGPTFTRAIERVGGTVLGGLVAALLAAVCTTPVSMSVALFPLSVLALAVRPVSYGLFITCITPEVVLLSELGAPGASQVTIALLRGLMTLAGGATALLFAAALWPAWEPERLDAELRRAIAAHGRYAAAKIAALLGEAPPESVAPARRAAGVASNALEASLQRALLEPRRDASERMESALAIDAALRRMAGRLTALHLAGRARERQTVSKWHAWSAWIEDSLSRAAEAKPPAPHPDLPERDPDVEGLSRLAAQVETLAAAAARLASPLSRPSGAA